MLRFGAVVGCLLAFVHHASAGFGAHWALNPHQNKSITILQAITTIEVPQTPSPRVNGLFLWPGLSLAEGGLVQSIVFSGYPGNDHDYSCGAQPGQWCAFSYLLHKDDGGSGKATPVNEGDLLTMNYTYVPQSGNYAQTITRDQEIIAQLDRDSDGFADNFYIEVECHAGAIGATPAHTYSNTTLLLGDPAPQLASTLNTNHSSNSAISTPDGGLTWTVDTIQIEAFECYPNRSDLSVTGGTSGLDNSTNATSMSSSAATSEPSSASTGVSGSPTAPAPSASSSSASSSNAPPEWSVRFLGPQLVWSFLLLATTVFCI